MIDTIRFVEYVKLEIAQEDGWLELEIPGHGCIALFHARYVESYDSGDYYWYGESIAEDTICYLGFAHFLVTDGYLTGTVKLDERDYQLYAFDEGISMLAGRDIPPDEFYCGQGLKSDTSEIARPPKDLPYKIKSRNGLTVENCVIRVLAVFTPRAAAAVPDIENTIRQTIRQTNVAFRRSLVDECDAELVLMDIQEIEFNERLVGLAVIRNDLNDLIADMQDENGVLSLNEMRFDADADVVLVFTDGNYIGGNIFIQFQILGIAGTLDLEPDRALAIIEAEGALNSFTGAHEIVHLLGGRHQTCAVAMDGCDDEGNAWAHAHRVQFPWFAVFTGQWHTIMYAIAGPRTVPLYSNPQLNRWGVTFGIEDERDNARQIRTDGCTVAGFQDDNNAPPMYVQISGSGFGCPCYTTILQAHIIGGVSPYQYQWSTSTDGFTWTNSGTLSSFAPSLPCTVGEGVFVRLTVISNDNQTGQTFRFVEAATQWPGQGFPCPEMLLGVNHEQTESLGIQIFPNPVWSRLTVVLTDTPTVDGFLSVYDMAEIELMRALLSEGNESYTIDVSDLPDAIYRVVYTHAGGSSGVKFIKLQNR